MKSQFIKLNLKDIPIKQAHGGSGSRQVLVKPEDVASKHLEAITKGFLEPGASYDWHIHENTDEFFIVLKGEGKFYFEDTETSYKEGDIFVTPPNAKHKITANTSSEFYFVRVK